MKDSDIHQVMKILEKLVSQWKTPIVERISGFPPDPFKVLISCLLSLRTKDKTTGQAEIISYIIFRVSNYQARSEIIPQPNSKRSEG